MGYRMLVLLKKKKLVKIVR